MNPIVEILYGFFLSPVYLVHTFFRKLTVKQKSIRLILLVLSPTTWATVFCIVFFNPIVEHIKWEILQWAKRQDSQIGSEIVQQEEIIEAPKFYDLSKEAMNWQPGQKVPAPMLTDFYKIALESGAYYNFYDNNSTMEKGGLVIFGQQLTPFMHGVYGLALYSSIRNVVKSFNFSRIGESPIKTDDFYDLGYASDFIGLPLFDDEKQANLGIDYHCYNPEMVRWLFDNMVPDPNSEIEGHSFQEIYNSIGQRYFRIMMESYLHLKKQGLSNEVGQFKEAMKSMDFQGKDYLTSHYGTILEEYFLDPSDKFGYLSPQVAVGYWLRRLTDGSAPEFFAGHLKVVKLYDRDWWDETLETNNFQEKELTLGPGMEAGQIYHVAAQFDTSPLPDLEEKIMKDQDFNFQGENPMKEPVLLASFLWAKENYMKIKDNNGFYVVPKEEKAECYIRGKFKIGNFEVFPFSFKTKSGGYWMACIMHNDKILEVPVLLSGFDSENDTRATSSFRLIKDGVLEINTTHTKGEIDKKEFKQVISGNSEEFKNNEELL